jgi:predicted nucleic acid-binding protein
MSGADARYLLDTNILLRLSHRDDPQHDRIRAALKRLMIGERAQLCYSLQNLTELWNVCTRPTERNGYGFSGAQTEARVKVIERLFTHLADTQAVCETWRRLVRRYDVRGVQVYDARLVATMHAYGIGRILTLNGADFKRYAGVESVTPEEVIRGC